MTVADHTTTTWTRVCPVDRLIPERGVAALVDGTPVAVFLLDDGTVRAVGHHDPFSNANVIARGLVGSVSSGETYRDTVASPMYKQVFDLATGECLTEPGTTLPVHPVRLVDGHVEVGPSVDPSGLRTTSGPSSRAAGSWSPPSVVPTSWAVR